MKINWGVILGVLGVGGALYLISSPKKEEAPPPADATPLNGIKKRRTKKRKK